ncbi:MAG: hypothetical protein QOF83_3787 [Solirubrobacteraceae bacterium]|nr:hypothetical protein [Solirubrobacteraceae bacterium]
MWLLGARDGAIIGNEDCRGIPTTRVRLAVSRELADRCSPWPLRWPRDSVTAFPAEVWIDTLGRVRRMGCDWVPLEKGRLQKVVERLRGESPRLWTSTEFWDFGAAML